MRLFRTRSEGKEHKMGCQPARQKPTNNSKSNNVCQKNCYQSAHRSLGSSNGYAPTSMT